jgi:hypothetical protein
MLSPMLCHQFKSVWTADSYAPEAARQPLRPNMVPGNTFGTLVRIDGRLLLKRAFHVPQAAGEPLPDYLMLIDTFEKLVRSEPRPIPRQEPNEPNHTANVVRNSRTDSSHAAASAFLGALTSAFNSLPTSGSFALQTPTISVSPTTGSSVSPTTGSMEG